MFRHSSKTKRMTRMGIYPPGNVHLFVSLGNLAFNEVKRENTMHDKKVDMLFLDSSIFDIK